MAAPIRSETPEQIEIRRPDDFHLHLRDGLILQNVLSATAKNFARALIMPNLIPPITKISEAKAYQKRILEFVPEGCNFEPLMTLYLTEETRPDTIKEAVASGIVVAVKLYPAGATTNSSSGVRDITKVRAVLDAMEAVDLPLCVHGELVEPDIDIFDRENVFIDRVLQPLRQWNPALRIVFEHITTSAAVDFVRDHHPAVAATITVHHLIINRSDLFDGGLHPHRFCFPVAKRETHRLKILKAALSGEKCFFLGTDSAPHLDRHKMQPCGCAGIYSAPIALPCLAQIFEDHGGLHNLEKFTSEFGAKFYKLPANSGKCLLKKHPNTISLPEGPVIGSNRIEVFDPGFPIYWSVG